MGGRPGARPPTAIDVQSRGRSAYAVSWICIMVEDGVFLGKSDRRQPGSLFLEAQHELRQPLNALSLLLGELREAENAQDRETILQDMSFALRLSTAWLDALADLDKAQLGLLRHQLQTVPLQPVFSRLAAEQGPRLAQLGLTFKVMQTRAVASCDPASLRRILLALLDNAAKFTREGKVLLGCRRAGTRLRIEVWDSGLGIAAGEEEQLFDAFFRLENEVRPRDRGLGLGLTYARLLARQGGGELTVRSRQGRWTCFSLTLPRARRQDVSAAAGAASEPSGGYDMGAAAPGSLSDPLEDAAVLLCAAQDAAVLQGSLEAWGSRVHRVSPADLLPALRAGESFDLLLTDQQDLVRLLGRERPATRRNGPAVIVICDKENAGAGGAPRRPRWHIIERPVKPARLRSLCHFALTQKET